MLIGQSGVGKSSLLNRLRPQVSLGPQPQIEICAYISCVKLCCVMKKKLFVCRVLYFLCCVCRVLYFLCFYVLCFLCFFMFHIGSVSADDMSYVLQFLYYIMLSLYYIMLFLFYIMLFLYYIMLFLYYITLFLYCSVLCFAVLAARRGKSFLLNRLRPQVRSARA